MILKDRTIEVFGYNPEQLTPSSHKKVVCQCDYCRKEYTPTMCNRTAGLKKLPHLQKDSCKPCKTAKTMESWEILGVREEKTAKMIEAQKKTNQEKYGADYLNATQEGKEKAKEAWASLSPERKEEIQKAKKKGMMDKYGVENSFEIPEVRLKAIHTWMRNLNIS